MKVLITSGGTKVPIDSVRHIGNFSSGRYGAEIAATFVKKGEDVIYFHERASAPVTVGHYCDSGRIDFVEYKDYFDYLKVKELIAAEQPDIIISAAAVSDFICDKVTGKISSDSDEMIIKLRKAEKVIASFRELASNAFIVGFKCLVSPDYEDIEPKVQGVLDSGADVVVYNDLTRLRSGDPTRTIFSRNSQGCMSQYNCENAFKLNQVLLVLKNAKGK